MMSRKKCGQCDHLHWSLSECVLLKKGVTTAYSACRWFKGRRLKRFFEWLYEFNGRIAIMKGPCNFLVDSKSGQRYHHWPIWDWNRVKALLFRPFRSRPKVKARIVQEYPGGPSCCVSHRLGDTLTRDYFNGRPG